ncbi:MAG: NAD(P)(+) transhydrogenase (Re/Si-specific) subunit beta [Alphaproteobacteria bacterium]|nr:NAD(P)(+) transhydrogenase (Re/Si-specific) subunit beta [Alphaproteobacteria bacterium]
MIAGYLYLVASICFILALRGLSSPQSAVRGNLTGIIGMAIAVVTTLFVPNGLDWLWVFVAVGLGGAIGTVIALRLPMTSLPQLMAGFHSLVGMSAVLIAFVVLLVPTNYGLGSAGSIAATSLLEMGIGAAIGAVTFTGSVVAFGKLQGMIGSKPLVFPLQHKVNMALGGAIVVLLLLFMATESSLVLLALALTAMALGVLLILPIGGADMPVVVSMLNSYSGWAACGIGFTLGNILLIITGALVGSSGAILSYIMCKAMNRSIFNVIMGGFGETGVAGATGADGVERSYKAGSAEDAAYLLQNASSVIVVPGYGLAVAQAQHAVQEAASTLSKQGVNVRYAVHPVAGRMPGHMNVLLAEANVPYEDVFELEDINRDFAQTDVCLVIGANDVTNPLAKTDPTSPIYGMPVLEVEKAKTVLFVKRSMAAGYAGVENPLFFKDNTMMLFGDAKHVVEGIIKAMD